MFGTLWAHSINTLLCWVHMERQILWRGCTNARWVNVFSAPDVHLLRLALKCQANWWCCVWIIIGFSAVKKLIMLYVSYLLILLLDGQFWLYTVHPLYGEAWCNPVLSLWSVTKLTSTRESSNTLSFVGSCQSEMNLWYTLCSDPKRKLNIGGRETFGRWTNLVFFSIVCPFVPFNYGEREDRKQYSSSWIHWFPMKT